MIVRFWCNSDEYIQFKFTKNRWSKISRTKSSLLFFMMANYAGLFSQTANAPELVVINPILPFLFCSFIGPAVHCQFLPTVYFAGLSYTMDVVFTFANKTCISVVLFYSWIHESSQMQRERFSHCLRAVLINSMIF